MSEDNELRLYCVMRADLDGFATDGVVPLGKLLAQCGHAFVDCAVACSIELWQNYSQDGARPKIVLRAKNEHELRRAKAECDMLGIVCHLIVDAGRTVFREPTATCLGIGPIIRADLPKFVQRLQLFG